jgi:sulfur relay (sulfurtransferase) complex TusBCD TusD component (DsrE family)
VASEEKGEIEVRLLSISSDEAKEKGVDVAPSIMANGRALVEGVPTEEGIRELIEKAKPGSIGIVITKSAYGSGEVENALSIGSDALRMGDQVDLFLLGDGVWLVKRGSSGAVSELFNRFMEMGGKVYVSEPHLKAGGLSLSEATDNLEIAEDPYDTLVDLLMEKWNRAITV